VSQAEEYRANADECEQMAGKALDDLNRRRLLELARRWRELASQVERHTSPKLKGLLH
jgi:hypothetical protein